MGSVPLTVVLGKPGKASGAAPRVVLGGADHKGHRKVHGNIFNRNFVKFIRQMYLGVIAARSQAKD